MVVETNKKQNNGKGKRKEKQKAREDLRVCVCVPLEEEHVKRETITSVHVAP